MPQNMTANQNQFSYFEKLKSLEKILLQENIVLTQQELKVLYWAIEGKTNEEIATAMSLSIYTIKTHKNNLIAKLNLQGKVAFQKYLLKMAKTQS